jgi:hypothetical protein
MFAMQKAVPGSNSAVSVKGSKTIALGFYGEDQSEVPISNTPTPFYFTIPRDTTIPLPEFVPLLDTNITKPQIEQDTNVTEIATKKGPINLLLLNGFLVQKYNVSIHYHIEPTNELLGYFAAMYFGGNPYLNSTFQRYHMWRIFCPWGKIYLYFFRF